MCEVEDVVEVKHIETVIVENIDAKQLLVLQHIEVADSMEFKSTAFHDALDEDELTTPKDINNGLWAALAR